MSGNTKEWLIVFLFFAGFFAFTIAETYWLHRKKGVSRGHAFGFSFASNIFTITVGFFLASLTFVAFVAMTRGDSLQITPDARAVAAAYIASLLVAVAVLILAKWLLLKSLKIADIERPFLYSIIASIGFFFSVLILPYLVVFLDIG
jgi:hypothetical protein